MPVLPFYKVCAEVCSKSEIKSARYALKTRVRRKKVGVSSRRWRVFQGEGQFKAAQKETMESSDMIQR